MGLTWQDVAGQVRAPDFSDSSAMITRGIEGLGTGVQNLMAGPDQRKQAQLARELLSLKGQVEAGNQNVDSLGKLSSNIKATKKEKDIEAFSTAQSILEATSRELALSGKPFEELFKTEAYQALPEGARAYGASHLSDAYLRGDETRMQHEEQAADNARQIAQFNRQMAQSESHFRQSQARQDRELTLREAQIKKAEQEDRESRGLFSRDPNTNIAIRQRMGQTQQQLAPVERGIKLYGEMSPREAAKKGGVSNLFTDVSAEAQRMAANVEKRTGKKVDSWMVNQLLAEGGSADNAYLNPRGGFDQGAAEDYLTSLVSLQDAALYNQRFLDEMTQRARAGETYTPKKLESFPIRTGVAMPARKPATKAKAFTYTPPYMGGPKY
jgi:hypothetical protein